MRLPSSIGRLSRSKPLIFGLAACAFATTASPAWAKSAIVDGDADGVDDRVDHCPYTPAKTAVDADGCAKGDDDHDGVGNDLDDCPYSPAHARVDSHGCALDADLDGIADGVDVCPATPAGVRVDARGCSPAQKAPSATASRPATAAATTPTATTATNQLPSPTVSLFTASFAPRQTQLGAAAQRHLLDAVPRLRLQLERHPRASLAIHAYADRASDGAAADVIAQARAQQVRQAVEAAGIDPRRLRSIGHPPAQGAQWRRIDIVLDNGSP